MQSGQGNWTKTYGGNGGEFTKQFVKPNLSLIAVRGGAGSCIDNLRFLFVDITTHGYVESQHYGKQGGNDFLQQAPAGEWITGAVIEYDQFVRSIIFITNTGNRLPKIGGADSGPGRKTEEFNVTGHRINGIKLKYGSWLDCIQFSYVK